MKLLLLLLIITSGPQPDLLRDKAPEFGSPAAIVLPGPELRDLPAVLVVYDPELGGMNCDGDCLTVASGPLEDWMYGVAGACDRALFMRTVYFPAIGLRMKCVDTGGSIHPMWDEHHGRTVLYFDVLWHLDRDGNRILGAPAWNYWLMDDWTVEH